MFANTQMGGEDYAFPDVCWTPPVPMPFPYLNEALGLMGVPAAYNVLFACTPAHNLATEVPITLGDESGCAPGGIISGTFMGPSRHLTAAFTVLVGGIPGTRESSISLQNTINMLGARIVPSQGVVELLSP
jgi:hypothetical protein